MTTYTITATPLGEMAFVARDGVLTGLHFVDQRHFDGLEPDWVEDDGDPLLCRATAQLEEYFAGRRRSFDLPLAPEGTDFQLAVWRQIAAIGYGRTTTYQELAAAIGRPAAVRAVGAATGRNPLAILIGCHRVLGSDGSLTGYAGGLDRKQALLALERGERALFGDVPGLPRP